MNEPYVEHVSLSEWFQSQKPKELPFGFPYWIAEMKHHPARWVNYIFPYSPTPLKEITMMTKKELRAKIDELEQRVMNRDMSIKRLEDSVKNLRMNSKEEADKYKALQQSICDLVEKADVSFVEKSVCVPKCEGW